MIKFDPVLWTDVRSMVSSHSVRILTTTVPNPRYDSRLKRGLSAVRHFNSGLPILVHSYIQGDKSFFGLSPYTIDIPLLNLVGITDQQIVEKLLAASTEQNFIAQNKSAISAKAIKPPDGEAFVACGKCQNATWRNTIRKSDGEPARSICLRCGNEIRIIRSMHQAGHG